MLKAHVKDGLITYVETDDGDEPQLRASVEPHGQEPVASCEGG